MNFGIRKTKKDGLDFFELESNDSTINKNYGQMSITSSEWENYDEINNDLTGRKTITQKSKRLTIPNF